MKRLRMFLIAAALMTGASALATAQPFDHDGRGGDRDRYARHDRDDRFRDRDDRRFDRDYRIGERRFFNGYYWNWDGHRWYRHDGGVVLYFGF